MTYDLIVFGGGTAGIAAAYIASKYNLNVLLVERAEVLGGLITQGLVVPCMKVNSQNINTEFFDDLKLFADKYNARHTYSDDNQAWFNHELLKIIFDDMLESVNCNVLFAASPVKIVYGGDFFNCEIHHKNKSINVKTKYIIDATSTGEIFRLLHCDFQKKNGLTQTPSLRFVVSNINTKKFASWLENFDTDRNATTVQRTDEQIYLSTAYTWDENKSWALRPLFKSAVENKDLEYEDTAYFQIFSIPAMPDSLNFNAPRIFIKTNKNLHDPFVYTNALQQGRKRIYRLFNFCKKYFIGFEFSYISHISDMLGVREFQRVKCKYTVVKDDIINPKKYDNIAFACDYPIDIHSNDEKSDRLEFSKHTYYIPVEALISEKYDNLYAAGSIISSDFEAHAAVRTQMSCFSMGEAAAKDIYKKLR